MFLNWYVAFSTSSLLRTERLNEGLGFSSSVSGVTVQCRPRGNGQSQRGLIVKVMTRWMIDMRPGCFCQPVRWLECLMFSLLVALLCIFLCQRRWAHLNCQSTSKASGHPSSSWRPECSASAECWWFVMTLEPADRQVSYKKTCSHFPFCRAVKASLLL